MARRTNRKSTHEIFFAAVHNERATYEHHGLDGGTSTPSTYLALRRGSVPTASSACRFDGESANTDAVDEPTPSSAWRLLSASARQSLRREQLRRNTGFDDMPATPRHARRADNALY